MTCPHSRSGESLLQQTSQYTALRLPHDTYNALATTSDWSYLRTDAHFGADHGMRPHRSGISGEFLIETDRFAIVSKLFNTNPMSMKSLTGCAERWCCSEGNILGDMEAWRKASSTSHRNWKKQLTVNYDDVCISHPASSANILPNGEKTGKNL